MKHLLFLLSIFVFAGCNNLTDTEISEENKNTPLHFVSVAFTDLDRSSYQEINRISEQDKNYYLKDENGIYYRSECVVIDQKTVCDYADQYVYKIEGIEKNSFEILFDNYAKDANTVFTIYRGEIFPFPAVDPKSAEVIRGGVDLIDYIGDTNSVFYTDNDAIHLLPNADPQTFEYLKRGYSRDEDGIFRYQDAIVQADPDTFEIINSTYTKDKNHVFYNGEIISGASPNSFTIAYGEFDYKKWEDSARYTEDEDSVFIVRDNKVVEVQNADPNTFQQLAGGYAKDKNHVFQHQNIIPYADPNTFERVGYGYTKDEHHVFYKEKIVPDADPNTFEFINMTYSKDKDAVFHKGEILPNISANSFEILSDLYAKDHDTVLSTSKGVHRLDADTETFTLVLSHNNQRKSQYAKDKNHVFFRDKIISGADSATFEFMEGTYLFRDKHHIYDGMILEEIDATTFEVLKQWDHCGTPRLYGDKNSIYFDGMGGVENTGIRAEHFTILNDVFFQDDKHIYAMIEVGKGCHSDFVQLDVDVETFLPLNNSYARDKNFIYQKSYGYPQIIHNVDHETFTPLSGVYSKDKTHVYYYQNILKNADPLTFQVIKNEKDNYGKDAQNVFFRDEIIEGADPKTFQP